MRLKTLFMTVVTILGTVIFSYAKGLPEVRLQNCNRQTVNTAELENDGKPMVVSFFALWCKPCIKELTAFAENYEQWQSETGVKIVAVSIDDARTSDNVPTAVKARGFNWETLLDPNSDFKRAMGVNQIPHTFLIDGQGNIVWQHNSYVDGDEEQLYEKIKELTATTKK